MSVARWGVISALRAQLLSLGLLAALVSGGGARAAQGNLGLIVPRYLVAGGDPADVMVQVRDQAGNPAPDGTTVAFVATLGLRFDPARATTEGGLAVTRLLPSTEAGFSRIQAVTANAQTEVVLWVRPNLASHVLWMRSEPSVVAPGGEAHVVALVTDAFGNLAEGDAVRWDSGGGSVEPATSRLLRGEGAAIFHAGPVPGPAWVRLATDGPVSRVAIQVKGPIDRSWLTRLAFLPQAWRHAPSRAACTNAVTNGSFEDDADADGLPDGWQVGWGGHSQLRLIQQAAEGSRALRVVAPGNGPPVELAQDIWIASGHASAELRLWVRGGDTGAAGAAGAQPSPGPSTNSGASANAGPIASAGAIASAGHGANAGPNTNALPGAAEEVDPNAGAGADLQVAVWAQMAVGKGATRVPVLFKRVPVADPEWTLLAFRLPVTPSGRATVELDLRNGAPGTSVDIDGVRLALCD